MQSLHVGGTRLAAMHVHTHMHVPLHDSASMIIPIQIILQCAGTRAAVPSCQIIFVGPWPIHLYGQAATQ